ncbi:uncharacterized protein CEXT_325051 [Caerostris extrusa]|uniref:LRRCT domain-containing protein n=1 Tax=Caerostris extrusa TaxID=172846 RepID=A0AAV4PXT7_CAEEX|nr:uncharacterized protein CEXT_325051 [Caerostris extrusa]
MTNSKGLNMLEILHLNRNRITTLGSSLQKLVSLKLLRLESNRLRTLGKEQIPDYLRELHLADNPFRCDCQMLLFLNYLNSTDNLVLDVPVCTLQTTPLRSRPHRNVHLGVSVSAPTTPRGISCRWIAAPWGSPGFRALFSAATEENSTSIMLSYPIKYTIQNEKSLTTISMNLEIQDDIAGLDVTNNSLQSMEEARLPDGMVHLFLANNQFRVPPTDLLNSQENLSRVTLSGNPWDCDCGAINFKKWIISNPDVNLLHTDKGYCNHYVPSYCGQHPYTDHSDTTMPKKVQDANITKCGQNAKRESSVCRESSLVSDRH